MLKNLLLAALAIGIAGPAHAGPVAAVVAWVGNAMAAGGWLGAVTQMAVGLGASLLSGVIAKAVADRPKIDVQFEAQFGDDTSLSFVVGDYATAGKVKYIGSWGKNSRYITEVIEVSCLPQTGLSAIWVDDEAGTVLDDDDTDGTGYNLGRPVTNYDDPGDDGAGHRIWVRWIDGTQTAADPMLVAVFGDDPDYPWTSAMIGMGKSYAVVTTRYDDDTLTSKPSYLFQPAPLSMYDPREDSMVGGYGSQRWGNRSTYKPTRNPAVIAYNIIRGIYLGSEWIFGGRNLPAWRLPLAEWFAAMNACDEPVALAGGETEPAYRCGLRISADMSPADVLEEIGRAANMRFAEVGGMIKPIVDLPGAAVFGLTDDDILITEGQSYKPFNSLDDTFNALSATYPEPAEKWSSKDAPEYVDADATAEDGDRYLPTSLAYPAAPYRHQVQRLMRAQMRDYRRMRRHQFHLPPDAYALEPGVDMVSWTSARNGYINKLFVVEDVAKTPGMNVLVTLREVDPGDYDWSSDFEMPTDVVTPVVPRPWVEVVTGLSVEGVIIRDASSNARRPAIRVSCSGDEVGITEIHIQARVSGRSELLIDALRPFGAPYSWYLLDVLPAETYDARAALISERTPRRQWSVWHTVTTPNVRLSREELEADILADLEKLEQWITDGVDDLAEELLALAQAIEAEATARADAAAQLAQDLAAEAQARADAIAAEQQARAAAVQGLADDLAAQAQAQANAVQAVADALATEQQGRLEDARNLADNWRQLRDRVGAITAEVVELANADHLAREEIRRSIALQIGELRASYDERISTIVGNNLAAVQRIETLEAASGNLTAEVRRVDQARIDGENALALSIASLAVGTDNQFDAAHIWHFDASVEGWTGGAWQTGGWLRTSGQLTSPAGLDLAGARYSQIRLRLRRSGSVTWAGYAWWAAAGQAWDAARRIAIAEPTWTEDVGLITVTVPWTGAIDRVRLEFGTGTLDLDWIALGRPAPGASSAELDSLRQAMISADEAMAEDITQIDARLAGAEGDLGAQAGAIDGLEARVTTAEGTITAQGSALTALEGRVTDAEAQVDLNADAIDALKTYVESGGDGSQVVAAEAIRALRSAVRRLAAEGAEAAARDHLGIRQVREYVAEASQSLNTRIDLTDSQVRVVAEAVTLLQAAIPGLASAQALQALVTTVIEQGDLLSSQAQAITDLQAGLDGKASAGALQQLGATVTGQGNTITAQGQAITALQSGLADKADASAVQQLGTTVAQHGADLSAQGQAITSIEAELGDLGTALADKAGASALQALEGRVDAAEGTITAQGSALTALEGRVTDAEAQVDLNADAIDALKTYVESGGDGSQVVAAEAIRALRSAVRRLAAEGAEAAARDHLGIRQVREYVAEASQSLNTRIDLTDSQVRVVAEAVTLLQAAIPGLASAQALQALVTTVIEQGDLLSSQAQAITDLQAGLDGKASAGALQQLGATVTGQGNTITAQGQAITALQSGLAEKADASAVQQLGTTVAQHGVDLSAQGQAITSIEAELGDLGTALAGKAGASALQALEGRVDAAEGTITAQSGLITNLRNDVDGKAAASALSALESLVSQQAGQISSQGSAIVSLNNSLSDTIILAEGKGRVFVQDAPPPVAQRLAQNLWIDTTGGNNIPKRWNGSAWVAVRDKAATDALAQVATKAEASALQALSNTVSQQGDVISSHGSAITTLENTIADPSSGLGSKASSTALTALTSRVSATETVANSKSRIHRGATPPANPSPSDVWYDTANRNKGWRWNGEQWTSIEDGDIPQLLTNVSAQADAITVLDSSVGRMRAGGRFRVSTAATPTGAQARIGLHAEASDGQATHSAGLFLTAESNGATSVTVMADRFAVVTGSGPDATRRVPFIVRDNEVWIDTARIASASIGTLHLEDGAVSTFERVYSADTIYGTGTVQTLTYTVGRPGPQVVFCAATVGANGQTDWITVRLYRNGTAIYQTRYAYEIAGVDINFSYIDPEHLSGTVTYRLDVGAFGTGATLGGVSKRFLGVLNVYK